MKRAEHQLDNRLAEKGQGAETVKLASVSSHLEAELLGGLLKDLGIPSFSLDMESGGYMRVYMGYSIFGETIYVRAQDFEAAKECYEQWKACSQENDGVDSEGEEEGDTVNKENDTVEEDETTGGHQEKSFKNPFLIDRRTTAILIIAAIVLGFLMIYPLR